MHSLQNIILASDLVKLPKQVLVDLCTDIGLPCDGYTADLAWRVWEDSSRSPERQTSAFVPIKNKIFCGRTSVTWYRLSGEGSLRGLRRILSDKCSFDPYTSIAMPDINSLSSEPVLIAAATDPDNIGIHFLRFAFKSGVSRSFYGNNVSLSPNVSVVTMLVDEEKSLIEIRSEPRSAKKIATALAQMIEQQILMEQADVIAPYGGNVEAVADAIPGGKLIDSLSRPECLLEDFSQEQAGTIVSILAALDNFLNEEDIEKLQQELTTAKASFGGDVLTVPFAALVLAGLDKVSLGVSSRDLREMPLYDYLRPHLQHQGGFIAFECPVDGVVQKHTVRIGLNTNSIFFATSATEEVIKIVREHVICGLPRE